MARDDRRDAKLARDRRVRIVVVVCGVLLCASGIFLEVTGRPSILASALIIGGGVPAGMIISNWWIYRDK